MKNIQWTEKKIDINSLSVAGYNPRKINKRARKAFTKNILNYGIIEPIVCNKDLTIIGGHQRYEIYLENGFSEVSIFVPDTQLTEDQEKRLNIILNSVTGYTDASMLIDFGFTQDILDEIGFRDFKLPVIKYNDKSIHNKDLKKNPYIFALFFKVEELLIIKSTIKHIIKHEEQSSVPDAVMFLLRAYVGN